MPTTTRLFADRTFWLAALVAVATFFAISALPGTSKASPYHPICAGANAPAQCWIPGLGQYLRTKDRICSQPVNLRNNAWAVCMVEGGRMSVSGRNCLIAAGITAGGVAVGGFIGGSAARAIGGGMVGGSGAACIAKLVG